MGRPRTIHIDRMQVLVGIVNATERQRSAINAELAELPGGSRKSTRRLRWEFTEFLEGGVKYDLHEFCGELTPSERIRVGEAIRQLRDDGLVLLHGARATRVLVTAAGIKAAAEHAAKGAADAKP